MYTSGSAFDVLIPNEYISVHETIQDIKVTIIKHITDETSMYCSEN